MALPARDAALLDAFCDALWLEDGLAKNTLRIRPRLPIGSSKPAMFMPASRPRSGISSPRSAGVALPET